MLANIDRNTDTNNENKLKCDNDVCELPDDSNNKETYEGLNANKGGNTPFWFENPNILFDTSKITEIYPTADMTYNRKLNAITRAVIYVSLIVLVLTRSVRAIFIAVITIGAIYLVYRYDMKEKEKTKMAKEGFSDIVRDTIAEDGSLSIPNEVFQAPTPENPFGNVLVSDYDYNVNKKPAPPTYNRNVQNDVLLQAKQVVRDVNGDQPEVIDKLFQDLGEQYVFEQSLRPFYSNPNTTIPNDQQAFAEFCYGSMVSCKEGNKFACARNLARHIN